MAQGLVKDYERLLKTLGDIVAWLEPVGIEASTFRNADLVNKSLVALYVHIIEFWTRAYQVYSSAKSRKLWGAFRAIWIDYDSEFETLKTNIEHDLKVFLASTAAMHHRQFDRFDKKIDVCKCSEPFNYSTS